MFKKTIRVERLRKAGDENPTLKSIPIGLENKLSEYIKTKPPIYALSHNKDVTLHLFNKNIENFKVDSKNEIGKVTGFDADKVYFKPKDKNSADFITEDHRVLFIFDTDSDNKVSQILLIYIQKETQEELDKNKRNTRNKRRTSKPPRGDMGYMRKNNLKYDSIPLYDNAKALGVVSNSKESDISIRSNFIE